MSGTHDQDMEVDFDQRQAALVRGEIEGIEGTSTGQTFEGSGAHTPSELCNQTHVDPDKEGRESSSDINLMGALEEMCEKHGEAAGRRYFGRFERVRTETKGDHGPWPIKEMALVEGLSEEEFWKRVGPDGRAEDQTIRALIELVACERDAFKKARGINLRAHVQRLYYLWLFLRAMVASPEAWKRDKMPHAAAAMRAMVAGPQYRYVCQRVSKWGDSAPLVTEAKMPLAAAPTALGCGNKSLCQTRRKGDPMNSVMTNLSKTERETGLIEKGKPAGDGNTDLDAGKRKFLAWAEMRPLPHAMPPSAVVRAIEVGHLNIDDRLTIIAASEDNLAKETLGACEEVEALLTIMHEVGKELGDQNPFKMSLSDIYEKAKELKFGHGSVLAFTLYIKIMRNITGMPCCLADTLDIGKMTEMGSMDDYNSSDPRGITGRKWFYVPLRKGAQTAPMPDPKILEKGKYDDWGEVYGGQGRYVLHGTTIENLWDILSWGKVCRSLPQNEKEPLNSPSRFRANGSYGGTPKVAAYYRPWCFLGDKWMIATFAVYDTTSDSLNRLTGDEPGARVCQSHQAITDAGETFLLRTLPDDLEKSGFARQFARLCPVWEGCPWEAERLHYRAVTTRYAVIGRPEGSQAARFSFDDGTYENDYGRPFRLSLGTGGLKKEGSTQQEGTAIITEVAGEARRKAFEEYLKYQKNAFPNNMKSDSRGKDSPYSETGSAFMYKAYRTALEEGDWPWNGLVGYGVMRRCITDPRLVRRILETGPETMITEGLTSLPSTPTDSEMAEAMNNERLDEISNAKDVDTMWKIAANYLHTLLGIALGADGMRQAYTKEGIGGITEKCIREGLYTSMFYAMMGISIHRTALLTAMWASGTTPPIMQRLNMRERIKIVAVVPESYLFTGTKGNAPDISGLGGHLHIQVSDLMHALRGTPSSNSKKRLYVEGLEVEVIVTKKGVSENMRIQGEYRVKAEGRSPEGSASDGGNGGEGTLYFVIHLIDGHGTCYGDFQQMVGIQARVEKESRKGEASGNDAHSMDTERVLINKMVEKKFMAECPTGVPNVQELWILPWSENDVTPRSEGNRIVAPTPEELEGLTRLIKAMGSIPIRHDMVSLMIPKTPHADWQIKMVQGGAYPVFTQIANVAMLGMMIPIRGEAVRAGTMRIGAREGHAGVLRDLGEAQPLTVEVPVIEQIIETHGKWIMHWAHCRRSVLRAKQAGAYPGTDERDLVARTKMQSPEPSEEDTMRMVSRASGGKSKAPFGTAVPQVQKLINTAIKRTMQEGTHISTGSFSSLGKWAELTKGQKITVTMGIWEMMREYALPAAPEPDTPIARGTVPENAPAQAQGEWIMSEEEFKQERDAEGGGLKIPKADVDKRKQHITKMATSSATRQQGRGAWNRAEKQAQGAHPLETLSESDDAVSDQGHTSSVPESGTSMMGRGAHYACLASRRQAEATILGRHEETAG